MGSAIPAVSFADEGKLATAVSQGRLPSGTAAVVYAAGATGATPQAQQRNLAHYYAPRRRASRTPTACCSSPRLR